MHSRPCRQCGISLLINIQSLATGVDEDYRKPKNLAIQLVRLLDEQSIVPPDRLRLIILYLLYRDGLLKGDIRKLLAHAQLPPQNAEIIYNMDLLGARVEKPLKDSKPPTPPLFALKQPANMQEQDISLSRFEPNVKRMLEEQIKGTLDPTIFPYTRPQTDTDNSSRDQIAQSSLRSAKPTWARTRGSGDQPRQRILVFMAGGATCSEARACYEVSQTFNKECFLATSHMLNPGLFLRQIGDLSVDKRRLDIPAERPKPTAPAHLFEKDPSPVAKPSPPQPVKQPSAAAHAAATVAFSNLNLNGQAPPSNGAATAQTTPAKPKKEKKKHRFF